MPFRAFKELHHSKTCKKVTRQVYKFLLVNKKNIEVLKVTKRILL